MANYTAIEQQHGHFEPKLPREFGIRVDIDDGDRRQGLREFELCKSMQHVLAQPAILTAEDHEPGWDHHLRRGASPRPSVALVDSRAALEAFTCLAMSSTVVGGTSPTAVIWWPSTTVEKAEEEPTRAGPSAGCVSGLRGSTNTDTEAMPSVKTRCATGSLEPGKDWAERVAMRNPGGNLMASHKAGAVLLATWRSARNQR